jgi:hypothetical protein
MVTELVLALPIGGLVVGGLLVAAGVPVTVVVVGAVLVCAAMTFAVGRGDPNGEQLLETARRAVEPPEA